MYKLKQGNGKKGKERERRRRNGVFPPPPTSTPTPTNERLALIICSGFKKGVLYQPSCLSCLPAFLPSCLPAFLPSCLCLFPFAGFSGVVVESKGGGEAGEPLWSSQVGLRFGIWDCGWKRGKKLLGMGELVGGSGSDEFVCVCVHVCFLL